MREIETELMYGSPGSRSTRRLGPTGMQTPLFVGLETSLRPYGLVGLVVMASASRAEDPGFESRFVGIFPGRVIPVT